MSEITVATKPLKTCFANQYTLPTFQREYKWESKHFIELLGDIQDSFLAQFKPEHGRAEVSKYKPYFLGSIITSSDVGGKKPIIDGQQRLTSLFVILAYFKRYCVDHKVADVADLAPYLLRVNYGQNDYNVEFSGPRKRVFNEYLNEKQSTDVALAKIDTDAELDHSDVKIVEAIKVMPRELDDVIVKYAPFFIDYLTEKVVLIDISVPGESDAHTVFVTMNDRGLKLGPNDLLKGHILSKITDTATNQKCHKVWIDTVKELRSIDEEEDSGFFRSVFRARWATKFRGKKKGDAPGDFDLIGDGYHRWFVEKADSLGIKTADDYANFVLRDIVFYAKVYTFIRKAEKELIPGFEPVYYNAWRKFTLQPMVLLAALDPKDTEPEWKSKIALIGALFDLQLTARSIEGKENNYDNLREVAYPFTPTVRGKDVAGILAFVRADWGNHFKHFATLANLTYSKADRTDLLYILARIACFIEASLKLSTAVGFPGYWERDRAGKTFDIEHVLRDKEPGFAALGFSTDADYSIERNKLGALVLLPRSRNRSLQDKSYPEKLGAYGTEGVLAQTLSSEFYKSNPVVDKFNAENPGFVLSPVATFDKKTIAGRGSLYTSLASKIWACP